MLINCDGKHVNIDQQKKALSAKTTQRCIHETLTQCRNVILFTDVSFLFPGDTSIQEVCGVSMDLEEAYALLVKGRVTPLNPGRNALVA